MLSRYLAASARVGALCQVAHDFAQRHSRRARLSVQRLRWTVECVSELQMREVAQGMSQHCSTANIIAILVAY